MSVDTKLRHELEVMDEKFSGDNMVQMLGMSTLNWMNVDSSRQLMFNSHIKQSNRVTSGHDIIWYAFPLQ